MSRTYEAEQFLPALIDAFQKEGHFVLSNAGKVFVRIMKVNGDEQIALGEFCLSDIAIGVAERLFK